MRWLVIILTLIIIIAAGIFGAGSALPQDIVTIRGAQFKATPEQLWPAISNFRKLPDWNPDVASVKPLPDPENPKRTLWHLTDPDGNYQVVRIANTVKEKRLVSQVVVTSMPVQSSWEIELTGNDRGTWVRQKQVSRVENPFVRFLVFYIITPEAGTKAYLNNLAHHFKESIDIRELAI